MGNLNQFYLMGRVANAPVDETTPEGKTYVALSILPGTGSRAPRGPVEPLRVEAHGPQVDAGRALHVGQCVLLRGQLRQEHRGGSGDEPGPLVLVARVQAIELLASEGPRPRRSDGEAGTTGRRRRRRRGRGRGEGKAADGEGAASEGAASEGEAKPAEASSDAAPAPPAEPLPPPKPIAPNAEPAGPLPDSRSDMPF